MTVFGENYFGVVDYALVGLTLLVSLAIGTYHAIKGGSKPTSDNLLIGGRQMSTIPVAISIFVTFLSAITIIGDPAEIYTNGIQFFWMAFLLTFPIMPLAVYIYMPVFYNLKITSVCQYFEHRFDSVFVRCLASGILLVRFTFLAGVTLYAPAIGLEAFLGCPIWVSIFGVGVTGTLYTAFGGFKAVIWTDVFQFILIVIGMVTICVKGFITAGGVNEAFGLAYEKKRLEMFNWNVDPFEKYNTLNFIIGYSIILLNFYGVNQLMVQRYSSLPTFRKALNAICITALLRQVSFVLIVLTGVAIFATYAGCDPILLGEINKADQIVPYFFIQELSSIPGMMGLVTSCIFSAVLSTSSSVLNTLAAITWNDFLSIHPYFDGMSPVAKGRIAIFLAGIYGVVIMGIAVVVGSLGSIFQVLWTIIGAFDGAVGGCFLMGFFIPSVNKVGASVGMSTSILSTGFLAYQAHIHKTSPTLLVTQHTNLENCPAGTDLSLAHNLTTTFTPPVQQSDWPERMYTISHLLYPTIGTVITLVVGCIASLLGRYFIAPQSKSSLLYSHPIVQRCYKFNAKPTYNYTECGLVVNSSKTNSYVDNSQMGEGTELALEEITNL